MQRKTKNNPQKLNKMKTNKTNKTAKQASKSINAAAAAARKEIRKMYEYCILTYYMEQRIYPTVTYTTCTGVDQLPAYRSGREKTDYLSVCIDAVALIRARQAAVREATKLAKNGVVNVENLSAAAQRNLSLQFGAVVARRRVINIRRYNNCGERVTLLLPATLPPREA